MSVPQPARSLAYAPTIDLLVFSQFSPNSFPCRTYENHACKSNHCRTYRNKGLITPVFAAHTKNRRVWGIDSHFGNLRNSTRLAIAERNCVDSQLDAGQTISASNRIMTAHFNTAGAGNFPLTRISVLEAARSSNPAERSQALDLLFAAYWKPIYKYIRLKYSQAPEDAQDLTQGFFTELMERPLLARFDPARSRLRTYLRMCVDSFALNELKSASRKKRGGDVVHLSLDFGAAEGEFAKQAVAPAAIPSPDSLEQFFEKEWIRSLFSLAVEDLRALSAEQKKDKGFAIFEAYDLDGDEAVSYKQLAEQQGLSVSDVTNSLAWARREFRRLALERLRALSGSDSEFEREARSLFGSAK